MKKTSVSIAMLFVIILFYVLISSHTASAQQPDVAENIRKIMKEKIRDPRFKAPELFKPNAATEAIQKILKEKICDSRFTNPQIYNKGENNNPGLEEKNLNTQATEHVVSGIAEIESEVHAAINPLDTNNMVCSSNSIGGGSGPDIPINHIYYTSNYGTSWMESSFNPLPNVTGVTVFGGGDPVFAYDKNGRAYYAWINLYTPDFANINWDLLWAYSDNGGATWQRGSTPTIQTAYGPIAALSNPALLQGPISDKEWLAVDVSNSPFQNTLYCAYTEADGQANTQNIVVRRKLPTDNFFTPTSVIVAGSGFYMIQFASIDVDNLGKVHISFFGSLDNVTYSLYHSMSSDGGATFSAPNLISNVQSYNFSLGMVNQTIPGIDVSRIYPCAYIAADKTNSTATAGNLYVVWTGAGITTPLNNGSDIYYSRSTDHGATWSSAIRINSNAPNDSTHQFYPCVNVSAAGTVAVCWYDRRSFTNENTHYYLAYSTDGGQTFGNDFQITSQQTDFATVGNQNQNFGIGEYNQVVTTPNAVIPFWADGRSNNGDLNIYSAIVLLDSIATSVESITGVNSNLSLSNIYPNPGGNTVSFMAFSGNDGKVEIILSDASGREAMKIFEGSFSGEKNFDVKLSSLSMGNYFIVMKNKNTLIQKRLSIQR